MRRDQKRLHFEGLGLRHYVRGPFRAPRKGEYYISGAVAQGRKAKGTMRSPYRIATPIAKIIGEKP